VTSPLNAVEALDMVPGWDHETAEIEELKGGRTNRVYHVRSNGQECVMRLAADQSGTFDLDRSCELPILETAGEAGIAPAILYSNPDAGILMTEYLHGKVWQESDLESRENIEALAALLRRVHALPPCCKPVDMTGIAGKYAEHLELRPGLHTFALNCVRVISESPKLERVACCHNDIVAANVIDAGGLILIDWEYACDNDPMFDLASAIGFHNFDEGRQQMLLSAYAGGAGTELQERLAEQIRVFDAIQWLWLATRHLRSPNRERARRLEELQQRIR
jgi:thiamine kinase-like enzyme